MIEYLDFNSVDLIATRVSCTISCEEFKRLKEVIEQKLDHYGKVSWYFEMDDFKRLDWNTILTDLKFSFEKRKNFEWIAFAGENFSLEQYSAIH